MPDSVTPFVIPPDPPPGAQANPDYVPAYRAEPIPWTYDFDPLSGAARATYQGAIIGATAAPGTSSTQLATTEFVTKAVVASTAGVASFNTRTGAVTLTTADITGAGGAVLLSPAFTGTPTSPTAAPGTNTTQLATCAFVAAALASSVAGVASWNGRTGAVILSLGDVTTAGGAPLNSPGFTGTPTSTTPPPGDNSTAIATTGWVTNAISAGAVASFNGRKGAVALTLGDVTGAGGAPTVSPTFTGTPTAPTPSVGDNSSKLATTAFVEAAVVASTTGVSSFNTRTGAVTLAGSDISNAGGALLASPAFTGTPTAPTPTAGDNSTKIATTAFVMANAGGASAGVASFNTRTGAVTLTIGDVTGVGGAPANAPSFTGNSTFGGPILAPAGSLAAPALQLGAVGVGLYAAAGVLDIAAGGVLAGSFASGGLTATLNANGQPISGVADPTTAQQAATMHWVQGATLPASGGTLSGGLTVGGNLAVQGASGALIGTPGVAGILNIEGPSGSARTINFNTGNLSERWSMGTGTTAESGSNVGSDLIVTRYNDNGAAIDTPLTITRATGLVTLADGGVAGLTFQVNGPAATQRVLGITTAGSERWTAGTGTTPESGANAGSDFIVTRYSDAGAALDNPLTITRATGIATFAHQLTMAAGSPIDLDAAAGVNRFIDYTTTGSLRWSEGANSAAETGANAGSDFAISRYNDSGAILDSPLIITRSTGAITTSNNLTVGANLTVNGSFTIPGTFNVSGSMTVGQNLTVSGTLSAGTFNPTTIATTGTITSGGLLTASNGLSVTAGPTTFGGPTVNFGGSTTVTVNGQMNTGNIGAAGLISANAGLTVPSGQTLTSAGTLTSTGSASFAGLTVTTGKALTLNGTATLTTGTGAATLGGTLSVTGATTCKAGLTASNNGPIDIDGAAGNQRILEWTSSGSMRWSLMADSGSEAGSNAGSDFRISRWSDTGTWIDDCVAITRSTGVVNLAHNLNFYTANTGLTWTSSYISANNSGTTLVGGTFSVGIDSPVLGPKTDNVTALGGASDRWTAVYAVNGTIQTSDLREKKRILDCDLGLEFVQSLRPVSYIWKHQGDDAERHYGLIAQQLDQALAGRSFAGLYRPKADSDHWGLNYEELTAPIIAAIQQLADRIEALEGRKRRT